MRMPGEHITIRGLVVVALAMMAIGVCLTLCTQRAHAHDGWINKGGYKNAIGEWCCGESDCAVMDDGAVTEVSGGYHFNGIGRIAKGEPGEVAEKYDEVVPYSEVMPAAKDGKFWRCKRPDKTRRCVFGPPPGS